MKTIIIRSILFCAKTILVSSFLFAQSGPSYRFENSTLISGTDKQVGAIYRFPTVKTGLDALVEIKTISSGVSLNKIDRTADGYSEAFQPEVKINGLTNGYIDFKITFVTANTNNPVVQTNVDASALDIDGQVNGAGILYEYNRIDMGGGHYDFNITSGQLVVSVVGTAYTAMNITGVLFGASVDTGAHDNMFTVTSTNISSFTFRAGANNGMSGSSTRYSSLYFMKFAYANPMPLALPKIRNFQGSKKENQVTLTWNMEESDELKNVILEKSENGRDYKEVGEFYSVKQNELQSQYIDEVSNSANVYYRLKLVSITGEIKFSNTLAFKIGDGMLTKTMDVYPSVFTTQFTAKINSGGNEAGILQMVDLSGRVVYQKQVKLQAGVNNVSVNDMNIHAKGNYIIAFKSGSELLTRKVVAL
jgi:hypothetical protein